MLVLGKDMDVRSIDEFSRRLFHGYHWLDNRPNAYFRASMVFSMSSSECAFDMKQVSNCEEG